MSKLVTAQSVAAAADGLTAQGNRVTVRAVIAVLGGGSPNEVLPLVSEWKAGRTTPAIPDIAIDPAIVQLMAKQIFMAAAESAAAAEMRAADVAADSEVIAKAGRAAEELAAQLQVELNGARELIQQQTGQLDERSREIQQVRSDSAEQVALAEARAQRERETAESVRQDLVRANIRVESVPRLEAENSALLDRVRDAEKALAAAKQAEAVATTKQSAESVRATECMGREKLALQQIQRLELALTESRTLERAASERAQNLERELVVAQAALAKANV